LRSAGVVIGTNGSLNHWGEAKAFGINWSFQLHQIWFGYLDWFWNRIERYNVFL